MRARPLAFALVLLLAFEFLLGMVTNLYVHLPAPHPGSGAETFFGGVAQGLGWALTQGAWALQLHALVGVGVIFTGVILIGVAYLTRDRVWMICAPLGVVGMMVAGVNGASFVHYGHDYSSLLMSVGFLVALVSLVVGLYLAPRLQQ